MTGLFGGRPTNVPKNGFARWRLAAMDFFARPGKRLLLEKDSFLIRY